MLEISDAIKKWLVLAPTGPPAGALAGARARATARPSRARQGRAHDLLIIGHPKSGNTWLRTMISRLYQVRYGLPASIVVTSDELARRNPECPGSRRPTAITATRARSARNWPSARPTATSGTRPSSCWPAIPCDIAVSWYFQFTKRQSAHKQELINHFIEHPIDRRSDLHVGLRPAQRHRPAVPDRLPQHLGAQRPRLERAQVSATRTCAASRPETLMRIVDLIGRAFSEEEIEEAVRFGSFDNLRQLESQGFFRQGGLNLRNAERSRKLQGPARQGRRLPRLLHRPSRSPSWKA